MHLGLVATVIHGKDMPKSGSTSPRVPPTKTLLNYAQGDNILAPPQGPIYILVEHQAFLLLLHFAWKLDWSMSCSENCYILLGNWILLLLLESSSFRLKTSHCAPIVSNFGSPWLCWC